ncbi:hypothetical protein EMEDMD4_380063 [Sinorhizobium medicae]|uniref:Uncharacterized protein n=1 Tax=Sinorhizobium medicae TaxID=110321 RepID=A0A508X3K1_9HYPH|nr:hypothetical protein EMEDMD4_380063 [Sinorhizobium medicae]
MPTLRISSASDMRLCAFLRRQNLAAAIHAGLQVDVMRAAQFAGILVFDVGRSLEGVSGTAHATLGRARFSFRYSHFILHLSGKTLFSSRKWPGQTDVDLGISRAYTCRTAV